MTMYSTFKIFILFVSVVLVAGCSTGGRWDRYIRGGSFIGAGPDVSPDGNLVVFSSPSTGNGDIYVYDIVQAKLSQITNSSEYEGDPKFSTDGKRIVFVREKSYVGHIWIMDTDGKNQKQLTDSSGYDWCPSFSKDDTQVVFTRDVSDPVFTPGSAAAAEIFIINANGKSEKRITNNQLSDVQPSFLPDGNILYTVGIDNISVLNVKTKKSRQLTNGSSASCSTDGAKVVFLSGEFGREISIIDIAGKNRRVLFKSKKYMSTPTFSDDQKYAYFLKELNGRGTGTIKKIKLADSTVESIVSTKLATTLKKPD